MTKTIDWPRRLRSLRTRHGLTRRQAAARADVAVRTWINWEVGTRPPGRLTAKLLALAYPELAEAA